MKINQNTYIFIRENTFENIVWKMAAILSRPPCVNLLHSKGITTVVLVTEQVTMHFAKKSFTIHVYLL